MEWYLYQACFNSITVTWRQQKCDLDMTVLMDAVRDMTVMSKILL